MYSQMTKILIAAVTLDGKIAKDGQHNNNWTSKEDKRFFRQQVQKTGAVIFGAGTYQAMGRAMPGVLNIIITRQPSKYQDQPDKVEFTNQPPKIILDKLVKRGYTQVIIAGGQAIYSLFLQAGLVDEIYLTIAPKIFGRGLNLFKELGDLDLNFKLLTVSPLGPGEVLVKYKLR